MFSQASVLPSIYLSVHRGGRGGPGTPPGAGGSGYPPGVGPGTPLGGPGTPQGGQGTPPGGGPGTPLGGSRYPPGGGGGVQVLINVKLNNYKLIQFSPYYYYLYKDHRSTCGRYASCVHAGGLSCWNLN